MSQPFSEDDIRTFLRSLKLGKYETEAYLTLVKHGPQDYKGLIKLSHIPYGKIYYTLNILMKKGWVKSRDQTPRIFSALNPEEPLMSYLLDIKKQLKDLENSVLRILPQIKTLYNRSH